MSAVGEWIARRLADDYIAGPRAADAIAVCKRVQAQHGWSSIMAFWNVHDDSPDVVAARCVEALELIGRAGLDCRLAIKAPALEYDIARLAPILALARKHGVIVYFDAQHPESAARTLDLLEKAIALYPRIGYTLPARWQRSRSDAERLIDLGVEVRIVKGQWPDPAAPHRDPAAGFMEVIETLAGRVPGVGVATHDAALARNALAALRQAGTPCELVQLYGLPVIRGVARSLGVGVRLYVPYGNAYMPYALSQATRERRVAGWFLRDLVLKGHWGARRRAPRTTAA